MNPEFYTFMVEVDGTYWAVPKTFTSWVVDGVPALPTYHDEFVIPRDWVRLSDDEDEAQRHLALHHFDDEWARSVSDCGGGIFKLKGRRYLIVTDDEAEDKFGDDLEAFWDEHVPSWVIPYFDQERWRADMRAEGRGRLAPYDGIENIQDINSGRYYIYRQS